MSAYGYDDDEDEEECPLCLDPLGDDIRFKPCNCGYRICAFCWNHIRTNLNGRCPACRKPYSDDAVEFTPMQPDELKRLQAAKKQRDKEKKDADSLSRKHAANVRVRQRSQVHIQGMTTKIANEDTLPALKGSEQFGRFGKIVKLFFSRRASPPPGATGVGGSGSGSGSGCGSGPSSSVLTPSSSSTASSSNAHTFYTPVNVYINYSRPDEAAACIYAIDGTVTSDGHKLKAIHGTTRYCPAYLRGVKCTNDNCMQAHEPGEELESSSHPGSGSGPSSQHAVLQQQQQHGQPHRYEGAESGRSNATAIKETREELVNLKHAYKEQSAHSASALTNAPGLPATASWASKQASNSSAQQASSQPPFQNQPSFSSAFPQIQDSRPTPPPSHSQSSSISSRLPKAQNHPLPPRPPSRTTSSVDLSAKSRANGRERERERDREQDQFRAREPEKQRQRSANAEDARQTQQQKADVPAVPKEIPKAQAETLLQDQQSLSTDGPAREELSSSATSTVIAPPTPPTSEPSASTSSLPALSLPPGLGLPSTSTGTRPLTPVSEFDRTLDTFGDGLSFHFNLPSSPTSTSPKGKERGVETVGGVAFDDGFGTSATQSSRTSRSGSPDFLSDTREMIFSPALPASSAGAGAGVHPFAADDAEDAKYQGPFDPFAMGSDAFGDAGTRADDATHHALASGRASGTASPATGLGAPPGLSRTNTASPMVDASMASRPPGLGGVPVLPDDGSLSGRHRSRFGFARSASIERPSSGFGVAPGGFANGVSIPVSELFKGVTGAGAGASSSSSSSSAHQTPVIANGRHSPHPPSSATSSASGNLPFSLPPGVFAPSPNSATVQAAFGTAGLPSASAFPASSSELPLPPPDPSRHAKTSLSDLFPGVDLAASFSSSSALPASLVKSLGISLENLDMQATAAANGKLPNFAPMPLGQGNSIASQPLPPPPTPSATSPSPVPSGGGAAMAQSLSTGATSSNGGLGGPTGLGAARQAQQAHAQHAQQAHQQALLAAQQAAAAQAAQNAAAQSAREQQQAQQQAQAQQQLQQHHGRPPSAASGGSASKTDMYGYMGLANATSPSLPQTPGGFGDTARFQDPAIISFAGMNGYAHPPQHNPYAAMHGYHHHHPEHPSPVAPGGGGVGVGQGEYYNRYHPLPTPVQPQQTYNPYMPIAPVGLAGMGRLNKAAQTMSQAGAFGLLRR